jgi:aminoglycoside 2''-phosphotransferase
MERREDGRRKRSGTRRSRVSHGDDLRRDPPRTVLCHGDFGGTNILYDADTRCITGILDWGFAGADDPASDIASLSCCGEEFLARGFVVYAAMEHLLPRARLYRGTLALQQALYALRDGNQEDFEEGMQAYI